MQNYNLPLFYKVEKNIEVILEKEIKKIEAKKILMLTDRNVYKIFSEKILYTLNKDTEIEVIFLEESTISLALNISEKVIEDKIDLIIGVGGGKVLDISKYVSFISKINFFSIPTTVANDGVASPIAVLIDRKGIKRSLGAKVPLGILIDMDIVINSPIKFLKAGIGDILSNYTALYDWRLSEKINKEKMNDFAYLLSKTAFNSIFYYNDKSLKNLEFIKQICEAIILSGIAMEIAGISRPCSGSEHLYSHYLDDKYSKQNLHGYQVAQGAIIMSYFQNKKHKEFMKFLKELDIDVSFTNLNISYEEFEDCLVNCKISRPERYTALNEVKLESSILKKIYKEIEEEFKK